MRRPRSHAPFPGFGFLSEEKEASTYHSHGNDQRAHQGKNDRDGHWTKHLSFCAGECKDRQVDQSDDQTAKNTGRATSRPP
jgi:hypothetical protein